jgi:hypothetical protein
VKLLVPAAASAGLVLAYIDHRPHFDDTGILAVMIATASAAFGAIEPRYAWLWALLIGGFIPLVNIATTENFGSLLALAFAFAGAYFGPLTRLATSKRRTDSPIDK